MSKAKRKCLSLLLILSLFVGLVGIVNIDTSYAASKKIHIKKKTVTIVVGKTYQQKLINKKGKTIKATKVKWKSSKPKIAKIDKKGKIKALKKGTVKMTAKYKGKTYKFTVKVKKKATPKIDYGVIYKTDEFIEYRAEEKQHVLFLGFKNEKNSYISPNGRVDVCIKTTKGETVFNKQIRFTKANYYNTTSRRWGGSKLLCWVEIPDSALVKGSSLNGTLTRKITFDDGSYFNNWSTSISNLQVTKEAAEKMLHDYIVEKGKEVKSSDSFVGDYYIQSSAYASSSSNRIVISTYVEGSTIIMYSIASDGSSFDLFHNQPDVQQGIDNYNYNTTEKDDSAYHFPLSYWGDIVVNTYSGKKYGEENGMNNCKKNGPTVVTDSTELYKVYKRTRDSMKEINDFLTQTMGYGLNNLGYSNYK